jgi:hypothetical protein
VAVIGALALMLVPDLGLQLPTEVTFFNWKYHELLVYLPPIIQITRILYFHAQIHRMIPTDTSALTKEQLNELLLSALSVQSKPPQCTKLKQVGLSHLKYVDSARV